MRTTTASLGGLLLLAGLWLSGCGADPVQEGWRAYARGEFQQAEQLFQEALNASDPRQGAEAALALAELALGRLEFQQAEAMYRRAWGQLPNDPRPLLGYAEALLRQGREEAALQALYELVNRFPEGDHVLRAAGLLGDAYATVRLTRTATDNYSPHFSPDGTTLLFTSHQEGSGDIYRLSLETLRMEPVVQMPMTNEYAAQFTPDGKGIVFASIQYRSEAGVLTFHGSGSTVRNEMIYFRDLETGEERALTSTPSPVANPVLRPDGGLLAFEAIVDENLDVWTMDLSGKSRTRWTEDESDEGNPVWLPDGRHLLYVGTDSENHYDLFLLDTQTRAVQRLTQTAINEYAGAFSPDGSAYVYPRQFGDAKIELAWMDWKSRRSYTISRGRGLSAQPVFSPDGSKLVFVSDRSDYLELYLMDLSRPVSADTLRRQLRARLERAERRETP
ncbi:MAG: hypothetical protein KatS3mg115_2260 [Candidatus Poribacteria bacterium]|nr:MAG: hypothetical protein KatS3mg115_2260 [Candidatus Poribacteria bacterium]